MSFQNWHVIKSSTPSKQIPTMMCSIDGWEHYANEIIELDLESIGFLTQRGKELARIHNIYTMQDFVAGCIWHSRFVNTREKKVIMIFDWLCKILESNTKQDYRTGLDIANRVLELTEVIFYV